MLLNNSLLKKLYSTIYDGLFPRTCIVCDTGISKRLLNTKLNFHCEKCLIDLLKVTGLKYSDPSHYLWSYEGQAEILIKKYKYFRHYKLAKLFAEIVFISIRNQNIMNSIKLDNFDIVCAVPSSAHSVKKKRFNHSLMLGNAVASKMNLPFSDNALSTKTERKNQIKLNKKQRLNNIKNAFIANSNYVKGKKILLIDDVTTTGATIKECKETLLLAGAKHVYALAMAKKELCDL